MQCHKLSKKYVSRKYSFRSSVGDIAPFRSSVDHDIAPFRSSVDHDIANKP
jgi:hypothetical protein